MSGKGKAIFPEIVWTSWEEKYEFDKAYAEGRELNEHIFSTATLQKAKKALSFRANAERVCLEKLQSIFSHVGLVLDEAAELQKAYWEGRELNVNVFSSQNLEKAREALTNAKKCLVERQSNSDSDSENEEIGFHDVSVVVDDRDSLAGQRADGTESDYCFYKQRKGKRKAFVLDDCAELDDCTELDDAAPSTRWIPHYILDRSWLTKNTEHGFFGCALDIAVSANGEVFVCDDLDQIQVFGDDGSFVRQLRSLGEKVEQCALAVSSGGEVFVCDQNNERVQVLGRDGTLLRQWGARGKRQGQFHCPAAVAVTASQVFVCDGNNQRVQVFGLDGSFQMQWGTRGSERGQFCDPTAIAVSTEGEVFVCDCHNNRVQVFRLDGSFLRQWGSVGTEKGQFVFPYGLAVSANGEVFVSDNSDVTGNRVQVFGINGSFVSQWSVRATAATTLAVSSKGEVFVCTRFDGVQVFRSCDEREGGPDPGLSDVPNEDDASAPSAAPMPAMNGYV